MRHVVIPIDRAKRPSAQKVTCSVSAGKSCSEAAVIYAGMGLPVVVLHDVRRKDGTPTCSCKAGQDCGSPGKHPRLARWKKYASTDPAEVVRLFVRYPEANVGLAMGGKGRLVAIDIDGPSGRAALAAWESAHGQLPSTLSARTGRVDGGEHRIFRLAKDADLSAVRNTTKLAPGIDVRSEGGQIVVPPSVHESGNTYEWTDTGPIAELPRWLFTKVTNGEGLEDPPGMTIASQEMSAVSQRVEAARAYLETLPPAVSGNGGHDQTFEAALAVVRGFCIPADQAVDLLEQTYNPRCDPPWSDAELRHKVESAEKDGRRPMGFLISPRGEQEKPVITVRTEENEVIDEAIRALARDARVFHRGGTLVRVVREWRPKRRAVQRSPRSAFVLKLPSPTLREWLAENAIWQKMDAHDQLKDSHPPDWVVRAVTARSEWPLIRGLEAIVEAPTLRPDGTILTQPGYDDATGLLLEPSINFPPIQECPTHREAVAAARDILHVWRDFPFEHETHKSSALAALLTLLGRTAIDGPTPLFAVDGTTRGVGKGLLADTIAFIATGRSFSRMAQADSDEEQRKAITALAMAGDPFVVIDNVARPLGSPSLDAALTGTMWKDRILGTNTVVSLDLRIVWMATGNNLILLGDTARRVLHIRLASPLETPEEREDFEHPDLLQWVRQERPRLVVAALTILRAYCAAGRPDMQLRPWGSFEAWSRLVRGAIVWVGLPDPAATRAELMKEADRETAAFGDFLRGLRELDDAGRGMTVSAILAKLDASPGRYERLRSAIHELQPTPPGRPIPPRSLGMKMHHLRERVCGGRMLVRRDGSNGAVWIVRSASAPEGKTGTTGTKGTSNPPTRGKIRFRWKVRGRGK